MKSKTIIALKTIAKTILGMALLASASTVTRAEAVTVKSCDRMVEFAKAPEKAVSNDVNLTEMMLVLGLQDRMVGHTGISGWQTLDAEIREGIRELPELSAKYPSREVLIGADADFFFAGWNYGMKPGGEITPATLAQFDIDVYELSESCVHIMDMEKPTMDVMYRDLENLGKIFRVEDKAKMLIDGYKKQLAALTATFKSDSDRPRVFVYDSGEDQPFTSGRYGMPTAIIEAAGGKNIMDDVEKSWTRVGWEPVIERNPQVIVIVNYGDVSAKEKISFMKSNPAFAELDAVKNDRFVVLEYLEATPGPRNIKAVEKLAEVLYAK